MIALLGLPPRELLKRSNLMSQCPWPGAIQNDAGKLCRTPQDYFGGPFFNGEGKFLYESLIPARTLESAVPSSLGEEERQSFLSFASQMLTWLPEERKTARELIEHPFLELED